MKKVDLPYKNNSDTGWQLLGELTLSLSSDADLAITPWLRKLLEPLKMSTDFLNRVLESAQDSVMRILQPIATLTSNHVHLSIFVPNEPILERTTWGFFHIERIENRGNTVDDHAIDFYLYIEGQ